MREAADLVARQLQRKADDKAAARARLLEKRQRQASKAAASAERQQAQNEVSAESSGLSPSETGDALAPGQMSRSESAPTQLGPLSFSGTRAGQRALANASPAAPPLLRRGDSRRYEPAKTARREDGRVGLRGVRSISDISRYSTAVDPYSRRAFEARKAFKLKKHAAHHSPASKTWGAVYSWVASEKDFEDWHSSAKAGAKYDMELKQATFSKSFQHYS